VRILPTAENGLRHPSYAKTEQIQTVSKERLEERIGRIDANVLAAVDLALKAALGMP